MADILMWDAAVLPAALPSGYSAAAGYIGGENAYRTWTDADWARVKGLRKLPIWVPPAAGTEAEARRDIISILNIILHYRIPRNSPIALDLETSQADSTYVAALADFLQFYGYGTIAYGSLATIETAAAAPPYIWRWTADWTGSPHLDAGAQATQYVSTAAYDSSVITPELYDVLWPAT